LTIIRGLSDPLWTLRLQIKNLLSRSDQDFYFRDAACIMNPQKTEKDGRKNGKDAGTMADG
jgi:hypothetical protein